MRILIACEFSGRVRRAFAAHGHDVWSCDLLPAEDGSARHIVGDVDSAKRVGRIHLYRPADVRRWHKQHIATRSPRGVASPIPK